MAIQALSGVSSKGYTNINFGKRKEQQPEIKHNVTSPMKAVPLAALIALSPLTKTNAENIMRTEDNANVIELAEAPQSNGRVLMYGDAFTSQDGTEVIVMAVNTKGGKDSFDKILINALDYTFEVKDIVDRNIYLYKDNGDKEGPVNVKEVIAETDYDGKKERFSFLDPNVVSYIESVVSQPTNQSNIKGVRKDYSNIIIKNNGDLLFASDDYIDELLRISKILFKDTSDNVEMKYAKKMLNAQELEDLAMDIEGDHGNYKLRFYDTDNDKSNYERMTLQKDGENEFFIDGITEIIGKIIGVDDDVELDNIYAIRLNSEIFSIVFNERKEASIYMVTDNEVVSVLLDAMRSPKFNNGNGAGYITVSRNESNLVLGDE